MMERQEEQPFPRFFPRSGGWVGAGYVGQGLEVPEGQISAWVKWINENPVIAFLIGVGVIVWWQGRLKLQ